jgi:hypothetical protein
LIGEQTDYIKGFNAAGMVCERAAKIALKKDDKERAKEIGEALVIFGYQLMNERVRVKACMAGMDILQQGLQVLQRVYQGEGDESELADVNKYMRALDTAKDKYAEKAKNTTHTVDWNCADLTRLAYYDKDRAWRVEAILRLGLARWTVPNRGDRRVALEAFQQLKNDPDPFISRAAQRAMNFEPPDVHRIQM